MSNVLPERHVGPPSAQHPMALGIDLAHADQFMAGGLEAEIHASDPGEQRQDSHQSHSLCLISNAAAMNVSNAVANITVGMVAPVVGTVEVATWRQRYAPRRTGRESMRVLRHSLRECCQWGQSLMAAFEVRFR